MNVAGYENCRPTNKPLGINHFPERTFDEWNWKEIIYNKRKWYYFCNMFSLKHGLNVRVTRALKSMKIEGLFIGLLTQQSLFAKSEMKAWGRDGVNYRPCMGPTLENIICKNSKINNKISYWQQSNDTKIARVTIMTKTATATLFYRRKNWNFEITEEKNLWRNSVNLWANAKFVQKDIRAAPSCIRRVVISGMTQT